jgi:putative endonuclease
MREYCVYMMTNRSGTLYIGVTNDIMRRVSEHKTGILKGFTSRYKMNRLLYVEATADIDAAIEREKQLKGWTRMRKLELVRELNPNWRDLSEEWSVEDLELATSEDKGQILRSAQNDNSSAGAIEVPPLRPERRGRRAKESNNV